MFVMPVNNVKRDHNYSDFCANYDVYTTMATGILVNANILLDIFVGLLVDC